MKLIVGINERASTVNSNRTVWQVLLVMALAISAATASRAQVTEYRAYFSWSDTAVVDSTHLDTVGPITCYLLLDVPDPVITFGEVSGSWVLTPGLELLGVECLLGGVYTRDIVQTSDTSYDVLVSYGPSCMPINTGTVPLLRIDLHASPNEFVPRGEAVIFALVTDTPGFALDLVIGDLVCFMTGGAIPVEAAVATSGIVAADERSFGSLKALYR